MSLARIEGKFRCEIRIIGLGFNPTLSILLIAG